MMTREPNMRRRAHASLAAGVRCGPVFGLLAALALAGCPGRAARPAYEGNLFEGPIQLSDQLVLEMDAAALPSTGAPCQDPQLVVITDIADGDTFGAVRVSDSEYVRVRMIGIDTPETRKVSADGTVTPAECFGNEAWRFTELLRGRFVWLTYDAGCTDSFGRDLAYVWVGPGEGDLWNRQLVRRGFADTLSISPNTSYADVLAADRDQARDEGLGLWSACE
jgi:micrococcal nuclease